MPNRYPSIVHYFLDQAFETAVEEALAHDDGEDEDDEYIQEEEEEGEEEEEEEGGGGGEEEIEAHETREYIDVPDSPAISLNASSIVADDDGKEANRRSDEGGKGCSTSASQENEWSRGEIEGVFCSICMEAWTTGGEHHICCLPCGHVYGFSCIRKWLQQQRSAGKCPQCNRKCRLKDVRKIFASRIAAVDEESHKRIRSLEAELASLEKKNADWRNKEAKWRKTEAELRAEVIKLRKRTTYMEGLPSDGQIKANLCSQQSSVFGRNTVPEFSGLRPCIFKLQGDLPVNGARMFDIDASRQTILFVRRISGMGGTYVLTRMSLIHPHETEEILLHPDTRAIKDLHISPNDGLALFGSLGKKLSVISMQSHNVILEYALPAAAWSCSWDINNSHFIYAGLQNGMLLVFDMRQTVGPLKSLNGLTSNPIHSIHPFLHDSTLSPSPVSVLSASSIGLCQWDIAGSNERPCLVAETTNPGVCISSAYCPSSNDIVASYRPKVELSDDAASSQPLSSASSGINGYGVEGSHVHFKKTGIDSCQRMGSASTTVNNIRLPKTSVIELENQRPLFAAWDECSLEILLQELPSFAVSQRFRCASYPIYDVKQAGVLDRRLLGVLSEDRLQLFGL